MMCCSLLFLKSGEVCLLRPWVSLFGDAVTYDWMRCIALARSLVLFLLFSFLLLPGY
ncbi:hypothetical protein BJX66DRAFT_300109 [Aspergillus keveii]|uniref:Uncharacterized protein n=1 Tax=Aspergillus keveii TaxID=714993 RepID=A0ABR4GBH7_9EURO